MMTDHYLKLKSHTDVKDDCVTHEVFVYGYLNHSVWYLNACVDG